MTFLPGIGKLSFLGVGNIAGALSVNIEHTRVEQKRSYPKETLDAYDLCLRAKQGILAYTAEGFAEAKELLQEAVEIDPDYAPAWGWSAVVYNKDAYFIPGLDPKGSLDKARSCAEKAISLDRKSATAYVTLAWVHMFSGNLEVARELLRQAIQLAPYAPEAHVGLAEVARRRGEVAAWAKHLQAVPSCEVED